MTIKLSVPDKNTKQKITGMKTIVGDNSAPQYPQGSGFANSMAVMAKPHTHMTKYSQIMSGGGITQAPPMFFSPLHTLSL